MDWILTLALGTFVLVLAFVIWNRTSTARRQATGGKTSGIGGPKDPMAGSTDQIRSSEAMAADLNDDGMTSPRRHGVGSSRP